MIINNRQRALDEIKAVVESNLVSLGVGDVENAGQVIPGTNPLKTIPTKQEMWTEDYMSQGHVKFGIREFRDAVAMCIYDILFDTKGNPDKVAGPGTTEPVGQGRTAGTIYFGNDILVPVGSIIAWNKKPDLFLPGGFVECNGQIILDQDSPYNGLTVPALNATNRFLRGAVTSGSTGGTSSHSHIYGGETSNASSQTGVQSGINQAANDNHKHDYSGSTSINSHIPPYFEVVWIIRIK